MDCKYSRHMCNLVGLASWLAMWNQIEGCEWLIKHILIMCARVTAMNYTITRYWPHTSHYGQRIINSANISFLESSEEMRIVKMLPSWLLVVIGHRVNKNFMSFRTTISCFITQEDCLQARSCCSWSSWIDFIFYNLLQLNLDPESITKLKNLTRSSFEYSTKTNNAVQTFTYSILDLLLCFDYDGITTSLVTMPASRQFIDWAKLDYMAAPVVLLSYTINCSKYFILHKYSSSRL